MPSIRSIILLLFVKDRKFYLQLRKLLGFIPGKRAIYDMALTHRSASVKLNGTLINNERLEFLGDAVLDSVIADYLFKKYPNRNEGFLSKMRSKIVKRKHMNDVALMMNLDSLVQATNINCNGGKHVFGNALEALIGAVYLDKGYEKTRKFILKKIVKKHVNLHEIETVETDFKSRIIEWAQKNHAEISFDNQEEYLNDEKAPLFVSKILIKNELMGEGRGASKKEAEQNAAEQAFNSLCN